MPIARRRLVVCAVTLLACAPYLALKTAWLAGTAVTVFAGPTKILLAHDGDPGTVVLATGVLGTVAGLWLARTLWRSPRAVLP